jgi:ATP-binding protein involved in chromosome partitioning
MAGDDAVTRKAFSDFAGNAARSIAMINANLKADRVAEVVG